MVWIDDAELFEASVAVNVRVMINGLATEPAPPLFDSLTVTVGSTAVVKRRSRRQQIAVFVEDISASGLRRIRSRYLTRANVGSVCGSLDARRCVVD